MGSATVEGQIAEWLEGVSEEISKGKLKNEISQLLTQKMANGDGDQKKQKRVSREGSKSALNKHGDVKLKLLGVWTLENKKESVEGLLTINWLVS